MNKLFKQKNKGFTLVETLVAISIFTMSILGLMSILGKGISDTNYAKQKTIATYLAQEGVEYIRNIRDTMVLYDSMGAQNGWDSFGSKLSSASCFTPNGCIFRDISSTAFSDPDQPIVGISLDACSGECPLLSYDQTTGRYGYIGPSSGFIRKIQAEQISADEIKIYSTVFWIQGSGNYQVTFSSSLFNWIE